MSEPIPFSLNHVTAPRLGCRAFIDLAATLGCVGVELRNDLADKGLTPSPFFDGEPPRTIGDYARSKNIRLLGLSEAYGFNAWSEAMREKVQLLVDQAGEAGAESISLIPRNDAPRYAEGQRDEDLRRALGEILPILDKSGMVALIEPLGFVSSSLRRKADAVAAIEAVGGKGKYKLVHDTFHHHLAGETEYFPDYTGIVHVSGVVDPDLSPEQMQDGHRILVDERDRLGNAKQVRDLRERGYAGAVSFEVFSPEVHGMADLPEKLRTSLAYLRAEAA